MFYMGEKGLEWAQDSGVPDSTRTMTDEKAE